MSFSDLDYAYYKIECAADAIVGILERAEFDGYPQAVRDTIALAEETLRRSVIYAYEVERLVSGDASCESFLHSVSNKLTDVKKVELPSYSTSNGNYRSLITFESEGQSKLNGELNVSVFSSADSQEELVAKIDEILSNGDLNLNTRSIKHDLTSMLSGDNLHIKNDITIRSDKWCLRIELKKGA